MLDAGIRTLHRRSKRRTSENELRRRSRATGSDRLRSARRGVNCEGVLVKVEPCCTLKWASLQTPLNRRKSLPSTEIYLLCFWQKRFCQIRRKPCSPTPLMVIIAVDLYRNTNALIKLCKNLSSPTLWRLSKTYSSPAFVPVCRRTDCRCLFHATYTRPPYNKRTQSDKQEK